MNLWLVEHRKPCEDWDDCAKVGKYMLCEKAMARIFQGTDRMIERARKVNVELTIMEIKEFDLGFREIEEILDRWVI